MMTTTWNYTGRMASGAPAKGKISASSEDEARSRLANMGISCESMTQDGVKPAEPEIQPQRPITMASPMTNPPRPVEPEAAPPEVERAISSTLAAFRGTRGYADEPQAAPLRGAAARRQQVLYGSSDEVLGQVGPILADKNGRVMHAVMHPDAKGKMTLLLVVEHDK